MKLQAKYTRATISAAIFVLILGSISYYFMLKYVLIQEVDDALRVEEQEILDHIAAHHGLPEETNYHDQQIHFFPASATEKRRLLSTNVRNETEKESTISRQLIFPVQVDGKNYRAVVTKSEEEAEDMLFLIALLTAAVILLLFVLLFIVNRILFKKIWKPFYATLGAMKQFNLSNPDRIDLGKNEIDEFNDLNRAVNEMTRKVAKDYESLKTFADNASHEMQTPLAVINSKLDLMIQDQGLTEKNMQHLQGIYDSVTKLTRMNQSLLLIAKIENHQFPNAKKLRLDDLLNDRLQHFEELIQSKQLKVSTSLHRCEVLMNPVLADIMLNNLLANAIRHNVQYGDLEIESSSNYIAISNNSEITFLDEKIIFDRFQKASGSDGLGIGLAIVKQICDLYGFHVAYAFRKHMHAFQVSFS
jgi:signal transduction histidine kinase